MVSQRVRHDEWLTHTLWVLPCTNSIPTPLWPSEILYGPCAPEPSPALPVWVSPTSLPGGRTWSASSEQVGSSHNAQPQCHWEVPSFLRLWIWPQTIMWVIGALMGINCLLCPRGTLQIAFLHPLWSFWGQMFFAFHIMDAEAQSASWNVSATTQSRWHSEIQVISPCPPEPCPDSTALGSVVWQGAQFTPSAGNSSHFL